MSKNKLHLHSMMVHAVAALVPLAAVMWILDATQLHLGSIEPETWSFLTRASLILVLLIAIPSTISGIGERNHMYANWHATHKIKLLLSLALIGLTSLETWTLLFGTVQHDVLSFLGFLIVVANNLVVFALTGYGLKITLGRQSLAGTSYVPDMFKDPPVDILQANRQYVIELPKTIDPRVEQKANS